MSFLSCRRDWYRYTPRCTHTHLPSHCSVSLTHTSITGTPQMRRTRACTMRGVRVALSNTEHVAQSLPAWLGYLGDAAEPVVAHLAELRLLLPVRRLLAIPNNTRDNVKLRDVDPLIAVFAQTRHPTLVTQTSIPRCQVTEQTALLATQSLNRNPLPVTRSLTTTPPWFPWLLTGRVHRPASRPACGTGRT